MSGGEGDQGGYLSIFGTNFGTAAGMGSSTRVYIGGVEVANYRYLGAAKVAGGWIRRTAASARAGRSLDMIFLLVFDDPAG